MLPLLLEGNGTGRVPTIQAAIFWMQGIQCAVHALYSQPDYILSGATGQGHKSINSNTACANKGHAGVLAGDNGHARARRCTASRTAP